MSKCKYCGDTHYGVGCPHSPTKKHEHIDDEKKCVYCGGTHYGVGCIHSPTKKHKHGSGANKCIWCGGTQNGIGCIHSPTKVHEKQHVVLNPKGAELAPLGSDHAIGIVETKMIGVAMTCERNQMYYLDELVQTIQALPVLVLVHSRVSNPNQIIYTFAVNSCERIAKTCTDINFIAIYYNCF